MIWKLIKDPVTGKQDVVWRELENGRQESCLVTAEQFKKDLANGAELQDADGVVIDGIAYLKELV